MFGAILNLFTAKRQQNAENARFEQSRADALAAEQRQLQYNAAARDEQRAYDEGVYDRQRADARADWEHQRAVGLDDTANQFVRLREAAERGGFNPLAVLQANPGAGAVSSPGMASVAQGAGVPLVPSASSIGYVPPTDYMGAAMADAGLLLADSFARTRQASTIGKLNAYQQQNNRLQKQVAKLTLRPTVPGVYAQRRSTGGDNGTNGNRGSASDRARLSGAGFGSYRPLLETDPFDTRRETQDAPIVSDAGVSVIDNPWMPRFYIPTFNGELMGLGEAAVVGAAATAQGAMATGGRMADFGRVAPGYRGKIFAGRGNALARLSRATKQIRRNAGQSAGVSLWGAM